jgi:FtsP/CotA-like multicopper oxidase with cupredoxin domain
MYLNGLGEKVSRRRYKEMLAAAKNRRELITAGLTSRRDLFKMGLLTAGGMLVAKTGLSSRAWAQSPQFQQGIPNLCAGAGLAASPATRGFVVPLPIMPVAQTVNALSPAPTIAPNTAAGEVRSAPHQAPGLGFAFPPPKLYHFTQQALHLSQSPDLPLQALWGFGDGVHAGSPGPTYVAHYGVPQLTRNTNALPPISQNGGFGMPSVTTHLHNSHNPSESDGNPCDFYEIGHFCDQYYPNVLAGFNSDHRPNGDINESLSTLWYHDHRVDFTSQNTYKGLVGFYLMFNQFDTGDETTGFHLPSFPQFDVPLAFADKVYDPEDGQLAFDLFSLDGIMGDKFLVNGQVQPFFQVEPRRYRFRLLDTGPSRFYEFFLTDPNHLSAVNPFYVIANDGNLLPAPVQVQSVRIGVAERVDIIIDFRGLAGKTIYLENRLNQLNGMGPVNLGQCTDVNGNPLPTILPAGQGNYLMQFRVSGTAVQDGSANPATQTFYSLPSTNVAPRITRTFKFDRLNGQWSINGQFMDCHTFRFQVQQNSVENWILTNATGDWTHPVHIHLEEHQILTRNRLPPTLAIERSRKDVTQLPPNERVLLFFRFRDWLGKYPIHCHNVVHEDHAMMGLWHVQPEGDDVLVP